MIEKRSFSVLLDVTRLISRVGFGPHTGIDRVERAYLSWCLSSDKQIFGLVRIADGYALLDRRGLSDICCRIDDINLWGHRDLRARLGFKTPKLRGRAEADIRRRAMGRSTRSGIADLLARFVPSDTIYLNVGHSNLTSETLGAMQSNGMAVAVFVHDTIPLDFPNFQRPGHVDVFQTKIDNVSAYADAVLVNSRTTADRVEDLLHGKHIITAHLGVDVPKRNRVIASDPYFVTLGTIEPRKNHALLLNVWDDLRRGELRDELPRLHIVGRRGWNNEQVFSRLDRRQDDIVTEHHDLPDADLWQLLSGAAGLLFPSFAEGFGLPSLEAAALGVPVVCGDLAIHHELLGDYPVYVDLSDSYAWKKVIIEQVKRHRNGAPLLGNGSKPSIPSWADHFLCVETALYNVSA